MVRTDKPPQVISLDEAQAFNQHRRATEDAAEWNSLLLWARSVWRTFRIDRVELGVLMGYTLFLGRYADRNGTSQRRSKLLMTKCSN